MRKITILCVGNLKETYLKSGCEEYLKRLSKGYEVKVVEVAEKKLGGNNPTESERNLIMQAEGEELLPKLKGYIVCLCVEGKQMTSENLSKTISSAYLNADEITFVIGGSFGLADKVKQRANLRLSFSQFTFPHQLMRLILLEQIYRASTIESGTPYHK